ncbi:unnamed protein product, partial [Ectocarpus sp. 12 AP-2014]
MTLAFLPGANTSVAAQSVAELSALGENLYHKNVSCWVCHGDLAEGRVGPDLRY